MNYLAHAYLAGSDEGLIIGNFIADHVRNAELGSFPPEVVKGILQHRAIDTFTDSHERFRESKRSFYPGFEKHSGILVDIYFDHLLASEFERYSPETLAGFSKRTYKIYDRHRGLMPLSSLRFLDYVEKHDIYSSYATVKGLEQVLDHLSKRIRHGVALDSSLQLFFQRQNQLVSAFHSFFDDARKEFAGLNNLSAAKQ